MRKFATVAILSCLLLSRDAVAQRNDGLIPELNRLAASGNAEAIYHLGMAYHTGSGVERNLPKALAAFRRAAELGDPLAAYKLGCYYDGQGEGLVERDVDLALRHKLVAARAGYALAQQDVANILASKGEFGEALTWLERAAAQGWADALATYASVHNGSPGVPQDKVKTAAYFRLYLEQEESSEEGRSWLASFEKGMTADERALADRLVASYRPQPTPLTLKALSGQGDAEKLVASSRR